MAERQRKSSTVGSPVPTENSLQANLFVKQYPPVNHSDGLPHSNFKIQQIRNSEEEEERYKIPYQRSNIDQEESQDKKKWTEEEERNLLRYHSSLGNRWTDIAAKFPDRDHNSVKNHFYAEIRKSIRRINCIIKNQLSQSFKPLNMSHVSKMITMLSQKKFTDPAVIPIISAKFDEIIEIKELLFGYSKMQDEMSLSEEELQHLKKFLFQINYFLNEIKKANLIGRKKKNKGGKPTHNPTFQNEVKIEVKQQEEDPIQNSQQNQPNQLPMPPPMAMVYWNNAQTGIPVFTANLIAMPQTIGYLPFVAPYYS